MWQASVVPNAGSARTSSSSSSRDYCDFHAKFTYAEGVSTTLSLPWSLFEHTVGNGMIMVPTSHLEPIDLLNWLRQNEILMPQDKIPAEMPMVPVDQLRRWLEAGREAVAIVESLGEEGMGATPLPAYPLDTS